MTLLRARVNLQDNNGICALMGASQKGHSDIVKLLMEYSAHVNVQDDDGLSALMIAMMSTNRTPDNMRKQQTKQ